LLCLNDPSFNKRIHFFANDVGVATDGTREEFGGLEDRSANFAEAEGAEDFVGGLLNVMPEGGVWGE
jgi:hypothetical protein